MLRQHEKLEDLEDKADTMRSEASKFKRGAGNLASKMWWQNMRLWCIIVLIAIIVLVIIVFSVCEPCRPGGGKRRALTGSEDAEARTGRGDAEAADYIKALGLDKAMQSLTHALPTVKGFKV